MQLGVVFSIFFLGIANISQAYECHSQISHQAKMEPKTDNKTYIDSNKIMFENKEIYVCLNQNWLKTDAVYSDTNGYYIVNDKGGWTCSVCGFYNTMSLRYCDNCHRER